MVPFSEYEQAIQLRQKLLAEAIRNGQQDYQANNGQMVSGRYVAPSWAQNLTSAMKPRQFIADANQLQRMQQEYANADQQAAMAHLAQRPVARSEMAGPVDPSNPAELAGYTPTQADIIKWAQSGANIPSRQAVLGKLITDLEVNDPIRKQQQAQHEKELQMRLEEFKQGRQDRAAEAEKDRIDRGEQAAANRVEAERRDRERSADVRYNTDQNNETRRMVVAANLEKAQAKADAKTADKAKGKTLPAGTVKDLGELDERANTLASLSNSFKDEYSGPVQAAKSTVSSYVPGMDNAAADWFRDYKKQQELVERHSLFGATLTLGEQKAWRDADINQSMKPAVIKKNLAERARLAKKVYANSLDRFGAVGYNIEGLGRVSNGGADGSWDKGTPTPSGVRKYNPATGRLE